VVSSVRQNRRKLCVEDATVVVYCVPLIAGQFRARRPLVGIGLATELVDEVVVELVALVAADAADVG